MDADTPVRLANARRRHLRDHLARAWSAVVSAAAGLRREEVPARSPAEGKPAESADRQSWRAVIDAMPDAALALNDTGTVVHHNALIADVFPNVRRGLPLIALSRNPELNEAVERALGGVEATTVVSVSERVPVERSLSAAITRLDRAGDSLLPALLVTFRDLTEQDRLAQMRADFIANASHELRTPLASLRGFVETLQGPAREDAEARRRFLAIMAKEASRMTRLIDDLLSLSRVEMRVHVPPQGITDLNEVAAFVVQALAPVAEASGITMTMTPADGSARIRGDREEIVQVVQNLVHNALKYGREGGVVEVSVARAGGRLTASVRDNGPGIAPEHLPRLTERFYRISAVSSREKGGTGLGLAIVKHIMNRHRAALTISSKLGLGSTFSVSFAEARDVEPESLQSLKLS